MGTLVVWVLLLHGVDGMQVAGVYKTEATCNAAAIAAGYPKPDGVLASCTPAMVEE